MSKDESQQVPPSSPPLLPSSPSLPVFTRPAHPLRSRKRIQPTRHHSGSSSDAPFFSSDDLGDATNAHYESPRQKRQYKRKWWETELEDKAVSHTEMRQATRVAKDSGIFVGSDTGSDASSGDGFNVACLKLASSPKRSAKMDAFGPPLEKNPPSKEPLLGEALVKQVVHECLESGSQVVNLDRCHLRSIPGSAMQELQHLIREPKFKEWPATDQAFQPLAPSIELILSSNGLKELPPEMFDLKHLSMLSLRNNRLEEISPAISKLTNLIELNVSGNRLRWLPWELLSLISSQGSLRRLNALNNAYYQPMKGEASASCTFAAELSEVDKVLESLTKARDEKTLLSDKEMVGHYTRLIQIQRGLSNRMSTTPANEPRQLQRTRSRRLQNLDWKREPIYLGRTEPSFMEPCGTVLRDSPPPPSNLPLSTSVQLILDSDYSLLNHPCYSRISHQNSSTVSLFETCLRACAAEGLVNEAFKLVPHDAPASVLRGLWKAKVAADHNGRQCSVCGSDYVTPRAEWIEYWHCSPETLHCVGDEVALPFLRQTCSWACALDVWLDGTTNESEGVRETSGLSEL